MEGKLKIRESSGLDWGLGKEERPGDREKGRLEAKGVQDTGKERQRDREVEGQWLQILRNRGAEFKGPKSGPPAMFLVPANPLNYVEL